MRAGARGQVRWGWADASGRRAYSGKTAEYPKYGSSPRELAPGNVIRLRDVTAQRGEAASRDACSTGEGFWRDANVQHPTSNAQRRRGNVEIRVSCQVSVGERRQRQAISEAFTTGDRVWAVLTCGGGEGRYASLGRSESRTFSYPPRFLSSGCGSNPTIEISLRPGP